MKSLKTVYSDKRIEVLKIVEPANRKKVTYTIDTCMNGMYMCIPGDDIRCASLHTAEQLKNHVEGDSFNDYVFTKEAYAECERYFSAIAL